MSVTIDGSAGVTTNTGAVYNSIQSKTAVASTSGTNIDFTSIPSWVKRITVMFNGVNSGGVLRIQLGSGTFSTSGYSGASNNLSSGSIGTNSLANGFDASLSNVSGVTNGTAVLTNIGSNSWVCNAILSAGGVGNSLIAGSVTTSGVLDRVRITTTAGTTFSAGSINILYE